jgi:lipoprotein-anchoring transpeptidase ErfK/SrfK
MTRRPVWFLLVVALLLGGCAGTAGSHVGSTPPPTTTARSAPIGTTTVARKAPTTVVARPVAPLPAYASRVAVAVGAEVSVYDRPALAAAKRSFPNPWSVDPSRPAAVEQQVFLVENQRADGWVQVLLPVRPNGSSGWVRAANVAIHVVTYSVKVELHSRQITVSDRGAVLYRGAVAIGKPSTPTPTGRYYVRVLIQAPNPHTIYGPYAYGLSSHSNALSSFDGGDAEIGLHGNDDASVLGDDVTHGCIRMDNAEITKLAALLPLGTPVDIAA